MQLLAKIAKNEIKAVIPPLCIDTHTFKDLPGNRSYGEPKSTVQIFLQLKVLK
jgi:hypothetical protein